MVAEDGGDGVQTLARTGGGLANGGQACPEV